MIAIIDYLAGNAPSVLSAVKKLGHTATLAAKPEELNDATHIILPGVGSAGATMRSLEQSGFVDTLCELVLTKEVNFLGVCVGMQILFEHSEEEDADCLGWLTGSVKRFDQVGQRVPQMGWNEVEFIKPVGFTATKDYFYFVNSYYAVPSDEGDIWGKTHYGDYFCSCVNRKNIFGTQFHIEKSGPAGLALLDGFLGIKEVEF